MNDQHKTHYENWRHSQLSVIESSTNTTDVAQDRQVRTTGRIAYRCKNERLLSIRKKQMLVI